MTTVNGLTIITPSSVAVTGTSATINANGSVSFSGMTNLQLRGVFSSTYENYMITVRDNRSTSNGSISFQLMAGTTPASGADYARQYFQATGTTIAGSRSTSQTSTRLGWADITYTYNHLTAFIFKPYKTESTAIRSVTQWSYLGAAIEDYASTHSLTTSYDGCVIFPSAGEMTGVLSVYGFTD